MSKGVVPREGAGRMSGFMLAPVDLLKSLASPDGCEYDHHGGCQAHGFLELEPGEKCPQRELRDLIEGQDDERL